jgi:uncharacterized protein YecE (DUF72 family)
MPRRVLIGTAGWSIPRASAHRVPGEGTHLHRYSRVFACTEINSSFHRPHAAATYAKWAASTPSDFRFALKLPRSITHDGRLRRARALIEQFLAETAALKRKRGPLLVQLPPSLVFDPQVAKRFFDVMRSLHDALIVCEPRHATWFSDRADALLDRYKVARVGADPPPVEGAQQPGGWNGISYFRLHGGPRKYWSPYDGEQIAALAHTIRRIPSAVDAWCVFDNTASGAAFENAWELQRLLAEPARP